MNRVELVALLEPHAHRPVRAFLRSLSGEAGAALDEAFWRLVYFDNPEVTHATASAVASELIDCERPLRELLERTYEPEAMKHN